MLNPLLIQMLLVPPYISNGHLVPFGICGDVVVLYVVIRQTL